MTTSAPTRTRHVGAGVSVLAIVGTFAALLSVGFFSGLPILLSLLAISRARRAGDTFARRLSAIALTTTVAGAGFAYWLYQSFLWDMHYHPGGGGSIPPPTTLELAAMPLIAGGIALFAYLFIVLARRIPRTPPPGS